MIPEKEGVMSKQDLGRPSSSSELDHHDYPRSLVSKSRSRRSPRSKSLVKARKRRLLETSAPAFSEDTPSTSQRPFRSSSSTSRSTRAAPSLFEQYAATETFLKAAEHDRFWATLSRPLPITFRVRCPRLTQELQQQSQADSSSSSFAPCCWATPLPWGENAWKLRTVYANQGGYRWLSQNTLLGKVSRQEWVSMLPVCMLGIKAHHAVLDLCAPGSKTTQAVDAMWDDWNNVQRTKRQKIAKTASPASGGNQSGPPPGFVIANEIDPTRSYILANRCRQTLRERHVSLAIVQHNATKFPNVQAPLTRDSKSSPRNSSTGGVYDRIICDVPCSGDGTLRKDFKVWNTWHPTFGIQELHALQLRIAKRGIALLKIGGIMTYSTCSFHAVENEAVVAALIQTNCVDLVPPTQLEWCSDLFRNMRYRPGLTDWKVYNDQMEAVPMEYAAELGWPKSLWPPREASNDILLQYCVRMVPHDNDTGGFFIAALRKVREFEPRPSSNVSSHAPSTAPTKRAMVTPQAQCHHLVPAAPKSSQSDESFFSSCTANFRRGNPGGSKVNPNVYELSQALSAHLTQLPGSSKLNLVTAGHKIKATNTID